MQASNQAKKKKASIAVAKLGSRKPTAKVKVPAAIEISVASAEPPVHGSSFEQPLICVLGGGVEPFNAEAIARQKGVPVMGDKQHEMLTATSQTCAYVRRRLKSKVQFMDLHAILTRSIEEVALGLEIVFLLLNLFQFGPLRHRK